MTTVKVCGNTDKETALATAALGVQYLGFIIDVSESPRSISVDVAQEIVAAVREQSGNVRCVGVFVDATQQDVMDAVRTCGFDVVQLHGNEIPEMCAALRDDAEVWKAIIIRSEDDVQSIEQYRDVTDKILLDAGRGSGEQFDYSLIKDGDVDVLAGGLNRENIIEAIESTHPHIVDLNSGVEDAPGKKNLEKIREIMSMV